MSAAESNAMARAICGMPPAKVDVLAVLAEAADFVEGFVGDDLQEGIDELLAGLVASRAAVAELLQADRAYDLSKIRARDANNAIVRGDRSDDAFRRKCSADHSLARAVDQRERALARVQP